MRTTVLPAIAAVAIAVAAGGAGYAADMATKAPPAPTAPAVPSWTGFYFGTDLGGLLSDPKQSFSQSPFSPSFPPAPVEIANTGLSSQQGGVSVGIHAGYNWQVMPAYLVGIEGDVGLTTLGQASSSPTLIDNTGVPLPVPNNLVMTESTRWLSSVRGRVGWLYTGDMMLYATGGVAFAANGFQGNIASAGAIRSIEVSSTDLLVGWVAGGGLEYRVSPNWTVRGEYLYYGLPSHSETAVCTLCAAGAFQGNGTFNWGQYNIQTLRLGVSYYFH